MLQLLDPNVIYQNKIYIFTQNYYNHTFNFTNCIKSQNDFSMQVVENSRIICKIAEQVQQIQKTIEQLTYKRIISIDVEFIVDSKSQVWIINCPLIILIDPYLFKSNEPRTLKELVQIQAFFSLQVQKLNYMKNTNESSRD